METPSGIRIIDYLNIPDQGFLIEQNLKMRAMQRGPAVVTALKGTFPYLTISLGARPLPKVYREQVARGLGGEGPMQKVNQVRAWLHERHFAYRDLLLNVCGLYNKTYKHHLIYIDTPKLSALGFRKFWDHETHHFMDGLDPKTKKFDLKEEAKNAGIYLGTHALFSMGIFAILSLISRDRLKVSNRAMISTILAQIPTIPTSTLLYYHVAKTEIAARKAEVDLPTPDNYFNHMFSIPAPK